MLVVSSLAIIFVFNASIKIFKFYSKHHKLMAMAIQRYSEEWPVKAMSNNKTNVNNIINSNSSSSKKKVINDIIQKTINDIDHKS